MGVGKYAALCKRMYIYIIGNQLTQNNDRHCPETLKCKKTSQSLKNVKKKLKNVKKMSKKKKKLKSLKNVKKKKKKLKNVKK